MRILIIGAIAADTSAAAKARRNKSWKTVNHCK